MTKSNPGSDTHSQLSIATVTTTSDALLGFIYPSSSSVIVIVEVEIVRYKIILFNRLILSKKY